MRRFAPLAIAVSLAVFLAGCSNDPQPATTIEGQPSAASTTGAPVQIANPASAHCAQRGGRVEIVRDAAGNESSICHLADGSAVEEWELFRRDNPQPTTTPTEAAAPQASTARSADASATPPVGRDAAACAERGGRVQTTRDADGYESADCVLPDGRVEESSDHPREEPSR